MLSSIVNIAVNDKMMLPNSIYNILFKIVPRRLNSYKMIFDETHNKIPFNFAFLKC